MNRDDIRRQIGPYWVPSREAYVTSVERAMITHALFAGYDVIVDATNFKPKEIIKLIHHHNATYEIKDFTNIPLEECIRRDSLREFKVGEDVIKGMWDKHILPKYRYSEENEKKIINLLLEKVPFSKIAELCNVSKSHVYLISKKNKINE